MSQGGEDIGLADVLGMNVDELRHELEKHGIDPTGLNKPELQLAVIKVTVPKWPGHEPPAAADDGNHEPGQISPHKSDDANQSFASVSPPPSHSSSKSAHSKHGDLPPEAKLKLREMELESEDRKFKWRLEHEQNLARFEADSKAQLEAERLRLEHEREKLRLQEVEGQRAHELALRQLEHDTIVATAAATTAANASGPPVPAPRTEPPFRVDAAVKLVPKFNESDVEAFLIGFEKVAELNNFPRAKYSAILQAHLTGKALKVFTELSTEDCKDYNILKAALLSAYEVVPEVYRRRFRGLTKLPVDTYSEYAFKLTTIFRRWTESEKAYSDIERLRELMLLEQFQSNLIMSYVFGSLIKNPLRCQKQLSSLISIWQYGEQVAKNRKLKGHGPGQIMRSAVDSIPHHPLPLLEFLRPQLASQPQLMALVLEPLVSLTQPSGESFAIFAKSPVM